MRKRLLGLAATTFLTISSTAAAQSPTLLEEHVAQEPTQQEEVLIKKDDDGKPDCSNEMTLAAAATRITPSYRTELKKAVIDGESVYTAEEELTAFCLELPPEYAQRIATIADDIEGSRLNGIDINEFWIADEQQRSKNPLWLSREKKTLAFTLEEGVERWREHNPEAYLRAATKKEQAPGMPLDIGQAYRFYQLGIPLEEIGLPEERGNLRGIIIYSMADSNGAFYSKSDQNLIKIHPREMKKHLDTLVVVARDKREWCRAVNAWPGAALLITAGHGDSDGIMLSNHQGSTEEETHSINMPNYLRCLLSLKHDALIMNAACKTGEKDPTNPQRNFVEHMAGEAPGRTVIGATGIVTIDQFTVGSWNPLRLFIGADAEHTYSCHKESWNTLEHCAVGMPPYQ